MLAQRRIVKFCEMLIYWLIVAIPFLTSFSSAAVEASIAVLIVAFFIKRAISREKVCFAHPILLLFVSLVVIAVLSIWNTVSLAASVQGLVKIIKYGFLLMVVVEEVRDVGHLRKIVLAAAAGLFLVSLDGIYQLVFGLDFLRHKPYNMAIGMPRVNATFPHTNIFAGYLALLIPVLVPLTLYWLKGKERVIGAGVVLLAVFCLVFTFCRSAILGLFLVVVFMSIIRRDKIIISLLLLCVAVVPFALPNNIKDWSKTTNSIAQVFLGKDRPIIYETALNMISQHPVLGVGVNTFVLNYQKYKVHDAVLDPGNEDQPDRSWYAHNSYLQMAAETGILYFFVFLGLVLILFKKFAVFYRSSYSLFLKFVGLGIAMGLGAFLVHGFTETNLYNPKIAVLFWFQVALLMAVMRLDNDSSRLSV